jgi:hypothetical protein
MADEREEMLGELEHLREELSIMGGGGGGDDDEGFSDGVSSTNLVITSALLAEVPLLEKKLLEHERNIELKDEEMREVKKGHDWCEFHSILFYCARHYVLSVI